jgi:hypothetical protein
MSNEDNNPLLKEYKIIQQYFHLSRPISFVIKFVEILFRIKFLKIVIKYK